MKILCNKNTTRLVKGVEYEALKIRVVNTTSSPRFKPTVLVKIGDFYHQFSAVGFLRTDGTKIDTDYTSIAYNKPNSEAISDVRVLKKGDYVVCRFESKTFDTGKKYKVSEVLYKETERIYGVSPSFRSYKRVEQKIKLEGSNRWCSPSRFRHCNTQEKRTLSLGSILGEEVSDVTDKRIRKIDRLEPEERDKAILSTILQGMLDPNRNNMSVSDWIIAKRGSAYGLNQADLKPYLKLKLADILKMME